MYRRILVGGATAAVIIGAGTASLALTGSDSTSGTPSATSISSTGSTEPGGANKGDHNGRHGKGRLLRRAVHGEIVTKGKDGFVTHNLIKGTVTAVSGASITVQAADKTSESFTVTKDTKVRVRTEKGQRPTSTTIAKVVKGDRVLVAGTGTTTLTAKHVIDIKTK